MHPRACTWHLNHPTTTLPTHNIDKYQISIRHIIKNMASTNIVIVLPFVPLPHVFESFIILFLMSGSSKHIRNTKGHQDEMHLLLSSMKPDALEFVQLLKLVVNSLIDAIFA